MRNKNVYKCKAFAFTLAASLLLATPVMAEVTTMPEVSEEMLSPDYWLRDTEEADEVLADIDTVKRLNESFLNCKSCTMNDLTEEGGSFNGAEKNLARWKSAMSDLAKYLDGAHYDSSDETVSGQYVMGILNNLDDINASEDEEIQYGICVRRSDVRAYPTELILADDPGDSDFDNVQVSSVRVGEPVTIYGLSVDGEFYLCHTTNVSGWIPSNDIALCTDKDEWLQAWKFPEDQVMVVTDAKLVLEQSNTSPELSGLMLTMGTVLEKAELSEGEKTITNRSLYYNYPVWIPVRNEEGMYERRKALISAHYGISEGFLPLTYRNILECSYAALGDAYGWGGMLAANDCSGYVRDVYKCFGLELPRNTTWQAAMPVLKYDISVAEEEDKKALLDELPTGTILFIKGHEMIYLGHEDGKYYVINSASSMTEPGGEEKARIRSVIINTLDEKRVNGNRWIDDIYEAAVPFVENEDNVTIPVFSSPEEEVSENAVSDGSVSADDVSDDSVSDNSVSEDGVSGNSVSENAVSEETEDGDGRYEAVRFDDTWEYAGNSKITGGTARLYRSEAADPKGVTICINAGHGTEGGTDYKTLCHPDGSPKIVTGSTAAGATEATAIAKGCIMKNGDSEAQATLKAALVVKEELLKAGYDVLMIREGDDVQLDNIARTLIADNFADAHIAIHYDSTDTDKGIFYCGVPDDEAYKNMEPVKSHWKEHEKLGKSLIYGLEKAGFSSWNRGVLEMDLTQTSYSTIPSVDLEIGDTASDYSYAALVKAAEGIRCGLDFFFSGDGERRAEVMPD
ncbi:MAG: SH3 domain-containing protein [Lachnospiraceae bacterium]|nr:SH3 domain-containing protein [Lachnospiraceae bacterium]